MCSEGACKSLGSLARPKQCPKVPCLSWSDQPNRRFPTSLSELEEQEAELEENFLSLIMDMENIRELGLGITLILGLSIALFGAFRAGQFMERKTFCQELENFQLEKLKLKTEAKLQLLCIEHRNRSNLLQLPVPDETNIHHIRDFLEKAFLVDETVREQIRGVTQLYIDLNNNGATSKYFVLFLDHYCNLVSGM